MNVQKGSAIAVQRQITIPSVPQPVIAWVHKYAGKQYWKVKGLCDLDDLIAEGYLAIAYCLQRYGSDLAPPHFMRLVQITYHCSIVDIAKRRTRYPETNVDDFGTTKADKFWLKIRGADQSSALDRVVADAPDLVKKTLRFMMEDVSGQLRQAYIKKNGERETTNARMVRLMNLHPSILENMKLMNDVRAYLRGKGNG